MNKANRDDDFIIWADVINQAKKPVRLFHLRHWNQHSFRDLIYMIHNEKLRLMAHGSQFELKDVKEAVQMAVRGKFF